SPAHFSPLAHVEHQDSNLNAAFDLLPSGENSPLEPALARRPLFKSKFPVASRRVNAEAGDEDTRRVDAVRATHGEIHAWAWLWESARNVGPADPDPDRGPRPRPRAFPDLQKSQ